MRSGGGDAGEAGEIAGRADGNAGFGGGEAGLDLLVNNGGAFRHGAFRDTEAAMLEALWRGNVVTAFTVTQALLPALIRAPRRLPNILSISPPRPLPATPASCAPHAAPAPPVPRLRPSPRAGA